MLSNVFVVFQLFTINNYVLKRLKYVSKFYEKILESIIYLIEGQNYEGWHLIEQIILKCLTLAPKDTNDDGECRIYIASRVETKEEEDDSPSVIFPNSAGRMLLIMQNVFVFFWHVFLCTFNLFIGHFCCVS